MPKRKRFRGVCRFHDETGTEGGYWAFQDKRYISPEGWSYKGLHILEDGDELTIFSPDDPTEVVWQGIISLRKYPPFTEAVFFSGYVLGFWIHADQDGVDREVWATYFLKEYPAELIPKK